MIDLEANKIEKEYINLQTDKYLKQIDNGTFENLKQLKKKISWYPGKETKRKALHSAARKKAKEDASIRNKDEQIISIKDLKDAGFKPELGNYKARKKYLKEKAKGIER